MATRAHYTRALVLLLCSGFAECANFYGNDPRSSTEVDASSGPGGIDANAGASARDATSGATMDSSSDGPWEPIDRSPQATEGGSDRQIDPEVLPEGSADSESGTAGCRDAHYPTDGPSAVWPPTTIPPADLAKLGAVRVVVGKSGCAKPDDVSDSTLPARQCSGVLLTNRWVLTSRDCLCAVTATNLHPAGVTVFAHGSADTPELEVLSCSYAERVIVHENYDVALIRLFLGLPLPAAPRIYTGDGTDLTCKAAFAAGFGPKAGVDGGAGVSGEFLNVGAMRVVDVGLMSRHRESAAQCSASLERPSYGPLAVPLDGSAAISQLGAEGGPLFVGTTVADRQLVGVLKGTSPLLEHYGYTGIWKIRDFILQNANDAPLPSAAAVQIPESSGAFGASLADDSQGGMHIVAGRADGTISHWRKKPNGRLEPPATVLGANTAHALGLGFESGPSGTLESLGMAYRDQSTGKLRYVRWSNADGWTAPLDVVPLQQAAPVITTAAPAMSENGFIAYFKADGSIATTRFAADWGAFTPETIASRVPPPARDSRLSTVYVPQYIAWFVGYRTPSSQWVQLFGGLGCADASSSPYWCAEPVISETQWTAAGFGFANVQHVKLVAMTAAGLEMHAVVREGRSRWAGTSSVVPGQFGVATVGDDVWIVTESKSGLELRKIENVFANDFVP